MSLTIVSPAIAAAMLARGARDPVKLIQASISGGARDGHFLVYSEEVAPDSTSLIVLQPDESFTAMPELRDGKRDVLNICAPSGCGKSMFAAAYARNYSEIYEEGKIFLISSVAEPDPAFAGISYTMLPPDISLDAISMSELSSISPIKRTLVIFDDIEGLSPENMKAVLRFQQRVLETGRKLNLACICIWHKATNGRSTTTALCESNSFVIFPASSSAGVAYALKTHYGIPPGIRTILKQPGWGRYVQIKLHHPQMLIGQYKAATFDPEELDLELKKNQTYERTLARESAKRAAKNA